MGQSLFLVAFLTLTTNSYTWIHLNTLTNDQIQFLFFCISQVVFTGSPSGPLLPPESHDFALTPSAKTLAPKIRKEFDVKLENVCRSGLRCPSCPCNM